jgi:hypothetical protein
MRYEGYFHAHDWIGINKEKNLQLFKMFRRLLRFYNEINLFDIMNAKTTSINILQ